MLKSSQLVSILRVLRKFGVQRYSNDGLSVEFWPAQSVAAPVVSAAQAVRPALTDEALETWSTPAYDELIAGEPDDE